MKFRRLGAVLAVASLLAGCSNGGGGKPDSSASVNGVAIPASRTEVLVDSWIKTPKEAAVTEEFPRHRVARIVLDYQIELEALRQLAAKADVSPRANEGDQALSASLSTQVPVFGGYSKGVIEEGFEAGRLSQALGEHIFPDVDVAEDEIRQSYNQDKDKLATASWQTTIDIAFFDGEQAGRQVADRLRQGAPLAEAVKVAKPLETGTIDVTPLSALPKPLIDAVGGLTAGGVAGPLRVAGDVFATMQAKSRRDDPALSLDQIATDIRKKLEDSKRRVLFYKWFNDQLSKMKIDVDKSYGKWNTSTLSVE